MSETITPRVFLVPAAVGPAITVSFCAAYAYSIPGAVWSWNPYERAQGGYFWLGSALDDEYDESLDRDDDWREDDDE